MKKEDGNNNSNEINETNEINDNGNASSKSNNSKRVSPMLIIYAIIAGLIIWTLLDPDGCGDPNVRNMAARVAVYTTFLL